jgi:hypothetical protein
VSTIAPHTEADRVAILVQFLSAWGSLLGRNPYFTVEATRHHTNLFQTLVGKSSRSRKGTSRGWIVHLLEHIDPHWTKNCRTGGMSSGEGLLTAVQDPVT